jgi:hypothetical protein
METIKQFLATRVAWVSQFGNPQHDPNSFLLKVGLAVFAVATVLFAIHVEPSLAGGFTKLPGEDASDKLEAAGTLLKVLDTGLFKWGARVFAGICIMSSAWALKEQRFGIAIICVIGAIIFGTAPKWVRNIFDIGDNQSLFSKVELVEPKIRVADRVTLQGYRYA